MSDLVTLTIDDVEVTVEAGTLVVDAAKQVNVDIPVFCYHPKMEPVGMCRMCLVEIGTPVRDRETGEIVVEEDGSPRLNFRGLQTGCTVPVSEGMVVRTTTDVVDEARDDIIEFLLTSHPLDCPICDKGGECPLQNLTMRHGAGVSRMEFTNKLKLDKHVPLGEIIYLDRERCIQCARCTRFQAELVDDPVIAFHDRGRRLEIVTNSEPGFDSIWSGNTTDICPVGALTTADFRFGARPWELTPVASVCPHCPVGCNTTLSTRDEARSGGRSVIKRIMPRQNEWVNEIWICDKGRFVHHYADAGERLTQPLIRVDGELVEASWEEALDIVAGRLQQHKDTVAGLAGDRLSNEDLFLFQKLFRKGLESKNVDLADARIGGGEVVAQVGLSSESNLQEMGRGDAILVAASDLHQEAPVWWFRVKQATERGARLIVLNTRSTRLDPYAADVFHAAPGDMTAVAHRLLNAAKVDVDEGEDDPLQAAAAALVSAENLVAFYGSEGLTFEETELLARTLANLLLLKNEQGTNHVGRPNNGLVAVWPHNNTQGAWDMGIRPNLAPGYRPLEEPGLDAAAIYAAAAGGDVSALYVLGADPIGDGLMEGRGDLEFLVVQELFLTETAQAADVVLPAQSWAERDGTYTSGERRVQRFFPAIPAVGQCRPDWQILAQVGERIGMGRPPFATAILFREIAGAVPQYGEMDYRKLALVVEQWPRVGGEDLYYGGTSYDNQSGVGLQWPSAAEMADEALEMYGLPPVTQEALAGEDDGRQAGLQAIETRPLYRAGTLIAQTEMLAERIAEPSLTLHPEDAGLLEVDYGDVVTVEANGVQLRLAAAVSEETAPGLALLSATPLRSGRSPIEITNVEKSERVSKRDVEVDKEEVL